MKRATKIAPTFGYSTLQNCVIEAIENRMQRRIPFISGRIAFPLRLGMERMMQAFTTAIPEDPSKELFIKRCTELIERRGHRFIRVGEKRINHKGGTEVFDITYGWPIKHYCRCSFSDNPIRSSDLKDFEVGVNPTLNYRNR